MTIQDADQAKPQPQTRGETWSNLVQRADAAFTNAVTLNAATYAGQPERAMVWAEIGKGLTRLAQEVREATI